jgi:hypothetical protein
MWISFEKLLLKNNKIRRKVLMTRNVINEKKEFVTRQKCKGGGGKEMLCEVK